MVTLKLALAETYFRSPVVAMSVRGKSRWDSRPQVGLIVETSFGSGRSILRGIARYARENGPWSVT